jgi:hypothetical protein
MKKGFKVIFVAKDKGGFDAIEPVVRKISKKDNFRITLILGRPSYEFARRSKIKSLLGDNLVISKINKIIQSINPNLIFAGTSNGLSIDKKLIGVAKSKKIPTACIVDYWGNYKGRFGKKMEYLPDYILALDESMKQDMVRHGISKNKIFITGNPRFDKLSKIKNVKKDNNIAVFYSQPFTERHNKNFNEITIFEDLVKILEKNKFMGILLVKFHPSEKKINKFDKIIKASSLKIKIAKKIEPDSLDKKAGLILGINSMALFDAALLRKKVVSYQPGLNKKDDLLLSNRLGWSISIYNKKKLFSVFRKVFVKPIINYNNINKYIKNNSTDRVIKFINNFLIKKHG